MRLSVDQDRCVAAGQCVLSAPEIFDQREEDGTVVLLNEQPAPGAQDDVEQAALLCPAQAISIVPDS
jgi:ferredoxin